MPLILDQFGKPMSANGQMRDKVEDVLVGEPLTEGYRPTLPLWALWAVETVPQFFLLRDIELMLIHPVVLNALNYFKGGVSGAEFEVQTQDSRVDEFVNQQVQRWWDWGVPKVQGGYEYGWIGLENLYVNDGLLRWAGCLDFSPRDSFLLTVANHPVGVRVKQVQPQPDEHREEVMDKAGQVDLWLGTQDVPAKGLWYAHNPRYNQHYGQSQLIGAWRPWRRLAWKDAAETVTDGGIYRFAYGGPLVKYPDESLQTPMNAGIPYTLVDSQGRPMRHARDMARQIGEQYKAGAAVGLPSKNYPDGGGPMWSLDIPKSTLNISGLLEYIKYLISQIREGVGVPGELLEAAESGSGYSGRQIPLEGFLMLQQRLADALLAIFVVNVLRPLVRWNFGPQAMFEIKVKSLLATKRNVQMGQPGETPSQPGAMPPAAQPANQPQIPGNVGSPLLGGAPQLSLTGEQRERIEKLARKILKRKAA